MHVYMYMHIDKHVIMHQTFQSIILSIVIISYMQLPIMYMHVQISHIIPRPNSHVFQLLFSPTL